MIVILIIIYHYWYIIIQYICIAVAVNVITEKLLALMHVFTSVYSIIKLTALKKKKKRNHSDCWINCKLQVWFQEAALKQQPCNDTGADNSRSCEPRSAPVWNVLLAAH